MTLNIALLETSFADLQAQKAEFTNSFYSTLFLDYPQVKPLFESTNLDEQSKKLFDSLVLVVNNLKKSDVLKDSLEGLGTRHVKYGVLPEHYPMVGGTLINCMAATLKDKWTPEYEQAWADAYAAITGIMLAGTDYSPEILDPKNG